MTKRCRGTGSIEGKCKLKARRGWKLCDDCLAFALGEAYAIVNSLLVEQDDEETAFGEAAAFFEERMGLPPARRGDQGDRR